MTTEMKNKILDVFTEYLDQLTFLENFKNIDAYSPRGIALCARLTAQSLKVSEKEVELVWGEHEKTLY